MNEVTFGFVKPDAYDHRQAILEEFILPSGLSVVREKDPYFFTGKTAREHYEEHTGKDFFESSLIPFTLFGFSGISERYAPKVPAPTALWVLEGEDAVKVLKEITGDTIPGVAEYNAISEKQTIRSRYGTGVPTNAFHRADSHRSARREVMLHFQRDELPDYVLEMLDNPPYI